jgi:NAD-dependent deacetylase
MLRSGLLSIRQSFSFCFLTEIVYRNPAFAQNIEKMSDSIQDVCVHKRLFVHAGEDMKGVSLDQKIRDVAALIVAAGRVVVFTGAGVSTESGIPDFRSPGGIWTKFDPEDFTIDRFLRSAETRRKQWRILMEGGLFAQAVPNRAHQAIAELERLGKLACVITQNIDNLHQKAGNDPKNVFELHGNMNWLRCLDCREAYCLKDILAKSRPADDVPSCERCRGILKPDVIFFGESLPPETLAQATHHASNCDLLMVVGSSLVVYPAAYMPMYAKNAGAKLVIINRDATPYDGSADVVINHSAGEAMSGILEMVRSGSAAS